MRVAFVTDSAHPDLTPDDRLAVGPLAARGVEVVPALWGRPLPAVAGAVVRSPWDYHHDAAAFCAWVEALPVPVANPPAVLRWNVDKSYLLALAARGVPTIPTVRVAGGAPLGPAVASLGAAEVVVKPEVSGGGYATFRVDGRDAAAIARIEAEVARVGGTFHVQPYLAAVATEGELSLVWLGGDYSHALAKRPSPGGFLVQEEHGGNSVPCEAPAAARAVAERALAAVDAPLLYARVDLLRDGEGWRVIELELVEPELFLRHHPEAPARFAEAVRAWLAGR